MSFKTTTLFVVTCVCIILMTVSCSRYAVHHTPSVSTRSGPPAHAPAHGYRRNHINDVELAFDSSIGVYIVVGHPDCYYHDGYYYRLRNGLWETSLKFDGNWKHASVNSLPSGLKVKVKANGNGNGNNKNRGKGKGKHKKDIAKTGRPF